MACTWTSKRTQNNGLYTACNLCFEMFGTLFRALLEVEVVHRGVGNVVWVAVKELKLSYHYPKTMLFSIYPYSGTLIYIP